jgi:hypothetical protein
VSDIAVWKAWQAAGHDAKGCAGWSQDFLSGEVTCACGEVVPMPAETSA